MGSIQLKKITGIKWLEWSRRSEGWGEIGRKVGSNVVCGMTYR
ncbi:hypothetical protein [Rubritalea tangerina]